MSVTIRNCPTCGTDNRATDNFCPVCGAALFDVPVQTLLTQHSTPAFSLPAYLLGDAKRRRRRPTVEGAGGGLVTIGIALVIISFLTAIGPVPVWASWGGGLLMIAGGLYRMRFDRVAFNRLGMATAAGGVACLGVITMHLTNVDELSLLRSGSDDPAVLTPVPDWIEAAATTPEQASNGGRTSPITNVANVPIFRGDAARTGLNPGPGPVGDPVQIWKIDTRGPVYASPIVVNGLVYYGTKEGFLVAADAATGEERWRYDSGGTILRASPVVHDNVLYLGAGFLMAAIDPATGQELWRQSIEFAGTSSPVVADGVVFVCSEQGTLYSFNAATGEPGWSFPVEGLFFSSPAVAEGSIYVGSDNGEVYALEADTGRQRWRFSTEGPVFASPAVADGTVYISSKSGKVFAVDARTGQERWSFDGGGDSSPAIVGGTVYVGGDDGGMNALDARTGERRWTSATGAPIHSSPAVAGTTVYVGSGTTVYAFDATTGDLVWRFPTSEPIESSPAVVNGAVFIGSRDGFLYAIGGRERSNATPEAG
jgi:outer membrane protein assembly factor BamB